MDADHYEERLKTTGRNDPCPCGSGKKYKKCHLAGDEAARHKDLKEAEEAREAALAVEKEQQEAHAAPEKPGGNKAEGKGRGNRFPPGKSSKGQSRSNSIPRRGAV